MLEVPCWRASRLLTWIVDYTLNNPDTLTKYKTAAQISEKVLAEVSKLCVAGEKIVAICEKGDKLIEEEVAKVYRGKKINKGTYCHNPSSSPPATPPPSPRSSCSFPPLS